MMKRLLWLLVVPALGFAGRLIAQKIRMSNEQHAAREKVAPVDMERLPA